LHPVDDAELQTTEAPSDWAVAVLRLKMLIARAKAIFAIAFQCNPETGFFI
jgi:hypothetical protein